MRLGRVAVIGDADSVLGFRGMGITVFTTDQSDLAMEKIMEFSKADIQLIFLTEDLASQNPEIMKKYNEMKEPTVILIPSSKGGEDYASNLLAESVKRAVGIDFLNMGNE